jgi:putative phosphoesterase
LTTRVGVIADTHCPEFVAQLPAGVARAFQDVDLIVHAGDVTGRSTLDELARIAPVEAVRGDHDRALTDLPAVREIVVEGVRIVVVHGQRARWIEEPNTLLWTLSLGYFMPNRGLPASLARRFPSADVIVFGHVHRPVERRIGNTLLFNPGAVHQWNAATARRRLGQRPGWFEWCWLQVARHLRRVEAPTVGILEIDSGRVVPRIMPV